MPNSLDTFRFMLFPLFVGTFPYKYLNIFCIFSFLFMESKPFRYYPNGSGDISLQWLFEYLAIVEQGGFFFYFFGLVAIANGTH